MTKTTTISPLLRRRRRWGELLTETAVRSVALLSFAVILLIFVFVFREAAPLFFPSTPPAVATQGAPVAEDEPMETYGDDAEQPAVPAPVSSEESAHAPVTLENLAGTNWQPVSKEPKFGLLPLIVGSLKVTLVAVAFGAPVAILAALFTAFFAPRGVRQYLKPAVEFLSGFPSVVIGFFALVELATLFQSWFGAEYRLNALVGGAALSLAVIPVVFTVAEDALSAVPKAMTEASLALGATRWETALYVVLPAATPGIFAALLLGVGRAFGETMIVLMATGNAALMSLDLLQPVRTMSATIGAEMAEVVFGDTHYNVLFLIGAVLFLFTFALNAVAEFVIRARLLKRFGGNQ